MHPSGCRRRGLIMIGVADRIRKGPGCRLEGPSKARARALTAEELRREMSDGPRTGVAPHPLAIALTVFAALLLGLAQLVPLRTGEEFGMDIRINLWGIEFQDGSEVTEASWSENTEDEAAFALAGAVAVSVAAVWSLVSAVAFGKRSRIAPWSALGAAAIVLVGIGLIGAAHATIGDGIILDDTDASSGTFLLVGAMLLNAGAGAAGLVDRKKERKSAVAHGPEQAVLSQSSDGPLVTTPEADVAVAAGSSPTHPPQWGIPLGEKWAQETAASGWQAPLGDQWATDASQPTQAAPAPMRAAHAAPPMAPSRGGPGGRLALAIFYLVLIAILDLIANQGVVFVLVAGAIATGVLIGFEIARKDPERRAWFENLHPPLRALIAGAPGLVYIVVRGATFFDGFMSAAFGASMVVAVALASEKADRKFLGFFAWRDARIPRRASLFIAPPVAALVAIVLGAVLGFGGFFGFIGSLLSAVAGAATAFLLVRAPSVSSTRHAAASSAAVLFVVGFSLAMAMLFVVPVVGAQSSLEVEIARQIATEDCITGEQEERLTRAIESGRMGREYRVWLGKRTCGEEVIASGASAAALAGATTAAIVATARGPGGAGAQQSFMRTTDAPASTSRVSPVRAGSIDRAGSQARAEERRFRPTEGRGPGETAAGAVGMGGQTTGFMTAPASDARFQSTPAGFPGGGPVIEGSVVDNPEPFIGSEMQGTHIGGMGAGPGVPELPFWVKDLNGQRTETGATLTWQPPPFDAGHYELVRYEVVSRVQGPLSTVPVETTSLLVPPGATSANMAFTQTFRFRTAGDVTGFVVRPVFRILTGPDAGALVVRQGTFWEWR